MPLTLVVGPPGSGKRRLVLDRFCAHLAAGREPFLVVPSPRRADEAEQELLARLGAVAGGRVGTLDDLVSEILAGVRGLAPALAPAARRIVLQRTAAAAPLDALSASARYP